MQVFRSFQQSDATVAGWGIRVLLLSAGTPEGRTLRQLAGLASSVETTDELYTALGTLIDDPVGYGLFVVECDAFGGLEAGKKALQLLADCKSRVPTILISSDCKEQIFPEDRRAPTLLRAPLSSVSMRVGFEHVLRDRFAMQLV